MKSITCLIIIGVGLCFHGVRAADASPSPRLTVEMRDGSRVVGNSVDDSVSVHSAAIGNLKLAWTSIRSLEYANSSDTARLMATNGDTFAVQLDADTLHLQTDFGKTELPVKMIRSIKVTPETKRTTAKTPPAVSATDFRLTIELRDGSHLVGKGLDDALNFHSPTMGDLKLTWAGIRSVIFSTEKSPTARLTTTNGDAYEVEFVTPAVRVETSFGKNELPAKSIRSIKVSAMSLPGQPQSGLVALWSGEGNANDSVGGNNGSSITGIGYADGIVGQAFKFNGSDAFVGISDPGNKLSFDVRSNSFTVAMWVNLADTVNRHELIIDRVIHGNNVPIAYEITYAAPYFMADCWDGNNGVCIYNATMTTPNVWYFVAMVCDTKTIKLYVNGKDEIAFLQSPAGGTPSDGIIPSFFGSTLNHAGGRTIGRFVPNLPYSQPWFMNGKLDEVQIYNRDLSKAEIQELYNAANPER